MKPGVEIITPHPKTSGNGRPSFLAVWGSVPERGGSEPAALEFVTNVYSQIRDQAGVEDAVTLYREGPRSRTRTTYAQLER